MSHDERRMFLPVLALDSLLSNERRDLEGHVEGCAGCGQDLHDYRETAAVLALCCEPVDPSIALRERVLAAVKEIPRVLPLVAERRANLGRHLRRRPASAQSQERFLARLDFPICAVVPLLPKRPGRATPAMGEVYVSGNERSGGLIATGLADPGKSIYQLWLLGGPSPKALTAFRPDARGVALVAIESDLRKNGPFAITLEARAGNVAPEGSMVLSSA